MNCKVLNIDCENNNCKNLGVNRKTNIRITPNTFLTTCLYDNLPETKGKRTKVQNTKHKTQIANHKSQITWLAEAAMHSSHAVQLYLISDAIVRLFVHGARIRISCVSLFLYCALIQHTGTT